MSSPHTILQRDYSQGRAITNARIVVRNPDNLRQITFTKKIMVDTGFDAGCYIRESEMSQLDIIGVRPSVGKVTLADNKKVASHYCLGYLERIGGYELPSPGIEITVVFQGTDPEGLLGLEVLSNWIVTFDGPAQSFKIECF